MKFIHPCNYKSHIGNIKKFPSPKSLLFCILFLAVIVTASLKALPHISAEDASALPVPNISANQAVLMNAETGEILYEKNAQEKTYPASTTKIMTALLTIETVEALKSDITQSVEIPAEAVGVEGSSIYLAVEEKVTLDDLLYGLILRSGNDAATALSYIIGGTQEHFIEMMNARAKELGCTGTNFLNPSGLYDDNHYTTAMDMALISQEAMKNDTFRKISSAKQWEASREPDKYNYFYNKNKVVHQYEGGNGIKIGFTKKSGRTLVASAQRDGTQLICVVMGAPDWFNDSYHLMDYGFSLNK